MAAKLDLSNVADNEEDRDTLLQLLFTFGVEPQIGKDRPTFVYHFPASRASLAQISTEITAWRNGLRCTSKALSWRTVSTS